MLLSGREANTSGKDSAHQYQYDVERFRLDFIRATSVNQGPVFSHLSSDRPNGLNTPTGLRKAAYLTWNYKASLSDSPGLHTTSR